VKNLLCLLVRGTFLIFYGLSMFKSKLAFAQTPAVESSSIAVADYDFSINAPAGWKVQRNYRGKTLVFDDPLISTRHGVDYSRNITVALSSQVKPIDVMELENLNRKLDREFGETVSDFQIIESKIIEYQDDNAILVFTSFTQGNVAMRQMHIFTSGDRNSALLTYTDLQESFEAVGGLDKAWASMMSAELSGSAPHRFEGLLYTSSGLAFFVGAAFLSKVLRRRKWKADLVEEEDLMFDDDDSYEAVKRPRVRSRDLPETHYAEQLA